MALPDAVKKSIAQAEADHAAEYGDGTPPGEKPAMEIVDAPPVETPPGEAPKAETPPAVPPKVEPEQPPASDDDDPKWKARYQALQGKYNKEIPRLNDENKELKGRLDGLEAVIAGIKAVPKVEDAPAPVLDQGFVDEYGEDMAKAMQTMVNQATAPLQETISTLQSQLQTQQSKQEQHDQADHDTGVSKMMEKLTESVPDWPILNEDQEFLRWLGQIDVLSGVSRQQNLDNALAGLKTDTVIAIFRAYKEENAGLTPPSGDTPPQPVVSKETLVAPGQAAASSDRAPEGNEKRLWTQAQITTFYNEVTAGLWKGREAEKLATEEDIIAAAGDGRIIS